MLSACLPSPAPITLGHGCFGLSSQPSSLKTLLTDKPGFCRWGDWGPEPLAVTGDGWRLNSLFQRLLAIWRLPVLGSSPRGLSFLPSQVLGRVGPRVKVALPQHGAFLPCCYRRAPEKCISKRSTTAWGHDGGLGPSVAMDSNSRQFGAFRWPPGLGSLTSFTIKSIKMSPHPPLFSIYVSDQCEAQSPLTALR